MTRLFAFPGQLALALLMLGRLGANHIEIATTTHEAARVAHFANRSTYLHD